MKRTGFIPSGRVMRIGLVSIAALALAALSFFAAVGEVFVRSNPVLAKNIGLANRAQANLNYTLLMAAAGRIEQTDEAIVDAAKGALAVQPLNSKALLAIATREFQVENRDASLHFARLSERVSRREFGAHILLFQDALLKNDLQAAFAQLDIGMRTAGERRTMLFPAITQGLKYAEFNKGLVPVMNQRRDWARDFLIYAVDEGGSAVEVATLFKALEPRTRSFLAPMLAQRTIMRLTDANQIQAARELFASLPGKDVATLSDPGLRAATFDPEIGTFGWQLEEGPTLTARVAQGESEDARAALIDVGPGDSSPALSRILFMPGGAYVFSARTRTDGPESDVSALWTLRCLGGSQTASWTFRGRTTVTIPQGCPAQLIQLIVTQEDASGYGQLLVEDVALKRM